VLVAAACTGGHDDSTPTTTSLPTPVSFRPRPEGVTLADPRFQALPGASAEYGRLGGAVYQIEIPDKWNGRLVLWMHGFGELEPEARAGPPDIRRHLIAHGYAWAASSLSSTNLVPGREADETAALWDHFVAAHGRPRYSYVTGGSMGGWATHIAADRYGDRFDGALGLCGAAGTVPGLRISAEQFVVGAYVAGVTQEEFDASRDVAALIDRRIRPALDDPRTRARFDRLMIELTGGPRAFDRQGLDAEEETNWHRAALIIAARIVPPRDTPYPDAGLQRHAIRFPVDRTALHSFTAGTEVTGRLEMPLLTMHTTGDGQVPISQAQILRARVAKAGRSRLLVQRVVQDPGHCGFTTSEQEAGFDALVAWVEHGHRPVGTDLSNRDLRNLDQVFERQPRAGEGARSRAVLTGAARLDGQPFDSQFIGAVVVDHGLVTPCQADLPPIRAGRFSITVLADVESTGCGRAGTEVVAWIYLGDQKHFSTAAVPWPGPGEDTVDLDFSSTDQFGAASPVTEFNGEVYRGGEQLPAGTVVDAYVGDTRCGRASTRASGSFEGFILNVVGPDAVAGCSEGAPLSFVVDGIAARETRHNAPKKSGELSLTVP
jgi:pimeloyl-ACP methyl ester carboxylesterase